MTRIGSFEHDRALDEVVLLRSLPMDGSFRDLKAEELSLAYDLHAKDLLFLVRAEWPLMQASLTYEGRKYLSELL